MSSKDNKPLSTCDDQQQLLQLFDVAPPLVLACLLLLYTDAKQLQRLSSHDWVPEWQVWGEVQVRKQLDDPNGQDYSAIAEGCVVPFSFALFLLSFYACHVSTS